MLFEKPLPFIENYVDQMFQALEEYSPGKILSRIQRSWICFCLMAIMVTNSVCWSRFQKAGIGRHSIAALSWMFRKSGIPWDLLLQMSVRVILRQYGVT